MPSLKIVSGPRAGECIDLPPGGLLRVGRKVGEEPGTSLSIDDRRLSRLHCEFLEESGRWIVRDCGSSNGTFVNGERISRRVLAAGDLIQAGGVVFEVLSVPSAPLNEGVSEGEADEPPPAGRPAARTLLAAGILVALAVGAYLAWPRGGPAVEEAPLAGSKPAATSVPLGKERGGKVSTPPAAPVTTPAEAPEPAAHTDDPGQLVNSCLEKGDYRRALNTLDVLESEEAGLEVAPLREKVLAAARTELAAIRGDAMKLADAGQFEKARAALLAFVERTPESLTQDVFDALDAVRRGETSQVEAERKREAEAKAAEREAQDAWAARLEALRASVKALESGGVESKGSASWESLCDEIARFVGESRGKVDYEKRRPEIEDLFVRCKVRSLDLGTREGLFAARRVRWSGDVVTLAYDFGSDLQLKDFHPPVGGAADFRRDGSSLLLQGECRLFQGNPFQGRLAVRGRVPRDGYDPSAPNIDVALFTDERDRLTAGSRARSEGAASLLAIPPMAEGEPPQDYLVFGLGYRTALASYGGKLIEEIKIDGSQEPVGFPADLLLAGKRGKKVHADPRECLWAKASAWEGALSFDVSLDGGKAAWKVNGKGILPSKVPLLERLGLSGDREGSVTLFTHGSRVRIVSLEVEGRVSRAWLLERFREKALAAFRALDSRK